ncbi:TetR/AcrR family transcriptional regulator [Cnuibacter sp. UC19_7]|uniref:TetR/AcrR family transcriptional regulator n=1 Tax=Cnuibacter sp. UC19_7 TaxID=3350166 RepID=UPI00366D8A69
MTSSTSNAATRQVLKESEDPRALRTRAALLDAIRTLSTEGGDLTVSALVRAAGISRASFYSHYESLDELASSVRREAFRSIHDLYRGDLVETPEALRRSQERLVAHFAENRALYRSVSALPMSREHYLSGVRTMAALIEDILEDHPRVPEGLSAEATARYIAGAAHGLLDAWIADELQLSETELVDHLTRLLPPWFGASR